MQDPLIHPTKALVSEDAEQILDAIRSGCVDAFVVEEPQGHAVYTLATADLPYTALVQRMQQGSAMLNSRGEIIYCNPSMAALLGMPSEVIVGLSLADLVEPEDQSTCQTLWEESQQGSPEGEVHLRRADNTSIPARFSFAQLARDKSITGVLVTDLTSEKSNAELASRIQSLQDEERRMIARELHDSVGQLLSAIAINISRVQKEASNLDPGILKMLNDNAILVEQVSKEIRTISHLLHPPLLDVAGLASAIRWYVDGFSERSRIKVDLEIPPELGRVDSQVEIAVFRIVQESLTNVYRHSGSPSCSVTVSEDQGWLRIKVCDSGRGIPGFRKSDGPSSRGMGLRGMQERLRRLGGVLYIDSNENGTTVTAAVPLSNQPMQMESAS